MSTGGEMQKIIFAKCCAPLCAFALVGPPGAAIIPIGAGSLRHTQPSAEPCHYVLFKKLQQASLACSSRADHLVIALAIAVSAALETVALAAAVTHHVGSTANQGCTLPV